MKFVGDFIDGNYDNIPLFQNIFILRRPRVAVSSPAKTYPE